MSNTTTTTATPTPDQAAEMFRLATTSATKWTFLDGVANMAASMPDRSQKDVVDMIGDTALFHQMHGDHRDTTQTDKAKAARSKAQSKLKSIRDELSVVKVWAPADRVDGVSFEAHKVLNRLGSAAGGKILDTLVKEMGGPGNVTKAAVTARLKVADPDHKPQANGKKAAAGNQTVTNAVGSGPVDLSKLDMILVAANLADRLTVGELGKDKSLATEVKRIVDIYTAFDSRSAAKAAATAPKAPAPKRAATSSAKRPSKAASAVKAPARKPQPKVTVPA